MSKMAASIPECVQTTKEGVSGLQKDKEVMSNVEKVAPETARKSISSFDHGVCHTEVSAPTDDSESTGVHVCEVCGTCFETRRGLSSHARSHLRQLGVAVSDSSGAPIDLLYQLIKERDGQLPYPLPQSSPAVKLQPKIPSPKKDTGTKLKIKISNLVKKKYTKSSFVPKTPKESTPAGSPSHFSLSKPRSSSPVVKKVQISTLPPASSPLSAMDSKLSAGSPSASTSLASAKPLWAPQETDAPLNLTMMDASSRDDVHVCEMCGAWFETRKGLSSHARAHLRHFGVVNVDAKGAPIELLHQILRSKDFQDRDGAVELDNLSALEGDSSVLSTSSISSKRTSISSSTSNGFVSSPLLPPSTKKLKLSPERSGSEEFSFTRSPGKKSEKKSSHGGASKDLRCEFCQETFKKSQSLASHARSHLRQLGITEWTVRGSPMATLREVIASRGISGPLKPPTDLPLPSPPSSSSSPPNLPKHSSTPVPHKVPKARKGSRLVSKPKDEPLEMDISVVGPPGSHAICTPPATAPNWSNSSSLQNVQSPHSAPKPEQDTLQVVSCEYCGELFDSRKALSCHARSHLRQLGVRWSVNCSPLDTLLELMRREGRYQGSGVKLEPGSGTSLNYGNSAGTAGQWRKPASSPRAFTPSPVDFSLKEKPTSESATAQSACDATCELCGFDFENRKALASHARAHLRQLGVEWRINGSPIETLSIWMQNEPSKVAELHKRYMQGDLPHIRRRSTSSPCASTDPESWRAGTLRVPLTPRLSQGVPQGQQVARSIAAVISGSSASESRADMSHSSHKKHMTQGTSQPTHGLQQSPVARSELNVRLPRGCERRPPKHLSHTESRVREARPSKPPRYGNIPSLVPRPPATSLVKLVGKVYSLKCRFCEEVFRGPLCVQEDWIMHLQKHILQLKRDSSTATQTNPSSGLAHHAVSMTTVSPPLIAPQAV